MFKTSPEVLIEREKTNRALALKGWGPTMRLSLLRTMARVPTGLLVALIVTGSAAVARLT